MDVLLLILGIAGLLGGLAGAFLPLPGPPLSFAGMLLLHYSKYAQFSQTVLLTLGVATALIFVFDYYAPIWGTKKFGGTNAGVWGSTIGVVVGFFVIPAVGLFLGAFLGALIGELIGGADSKTALRAAIGSFVGLVTGIFMKVILCLVMIGFSIAAFLN